MFLSTSFSFGREQNRQLDEETYLRKGRDPKRAAYVPIAMLNPSAKKKRHQEVNDRVKRHHAKKKEGITYLSERGKINETRSSGQVLTVKLPTYSSKKPKSNEKKFMALAKTKAMVGIFPDK